QKIFKYVRLTRKSLYGHLLVSWDIQDNYVTQDVNYTLLTEYFRIGDCADNNNVSNPKQEIPLQSMVRSYELQNVISWSSLAVTLRGVEQTHGLTDYITETVVTHETIPVGKPVNIHPMSIQPNSAQIAWDPPICEERGGLRIRYDVEMAPKNSPMSPKLMTTNTEYIALASLTAFTTYQIRTRYVNSAGVGPFSDFYIFQTGQGPPGAPIVYNFTYDDISIGVVIVQPAQPNGQIDQFNIELTGGLNHMSDLYTPLNGSEYIIGNLMSNTSYLIRARARNAAGWGDWSKHIQVSTKPEIKPSPIALRQFMANMTCIGFQWAPPPSADLHLVHSYEIRVFSSDQTILPIRVFVSKDNHEHIQCGLNPYTQYSVSVSVMKGTGQTGHPLAARMWTEGMTPPKPRPPVIRKETTTTVTIEVFPVLFDYGPITAYQIRLLRVFHNHTVRDPHPLGSDVFGDDVPLWFLEDKAAKQDQRLNSDAIRGNMGSLEPPRDMGQGNNVPNIIPLGKRSANDEAKPARQMTSRMSYDDETIQPGNVFLLTIPSATIRRCDLDSWFMEWKQKWLNNSERSPKYVKRTALPSSGCYVDDSLLSPEIVHLENTESSSGKGSKNRRKRSFGSPPGVLWLELLEKDIPEPGFWVIGDEQMYHGRRNLALEPDTEYAIIFAVESTVVDITKHAYSMATTTAFTLSQEVKWLTEKQKMIIKFAILPISILLFFLFGFFVIRHILLAAKNAKSSPNTRQKNVDYGQEEDIHEEEGHDVLEDEDSNDDYMPLQKKSLTEPSKLTEKDSKLEQFFNPTQNIGQPRFITTMRENILYNDNNRNAGNDNNSAGPATRVVQFESDGDSDSPDDQSYSLPLDPCPPAYTDLGNANNNECSPSRTSFLSGEGGLSPVKVNAFEAVAGTDCTRVTSPCSCGDYEGMQGFEHDGDCRQCECQQNDVTLVDMSDFESDESVFELDTGLNQRTNNLMASVVDPFTLRTQTNCDSPRLKTFTSHQVPFTSSSTNKLVSTTWNICEKSLSGYFNNNNNSIVHSPPSNRRELCKVDIMDSRKEINLDGFDFDCREELIRSKTWLTRSIDFHNYLNDNMAVEDSFNVAKDCLLSHKDDDNDIGFSREKVQNPECSGDPPSFCEINDVTNDEICKACNDVIKELEMDTKSLSELSRLSCNDKRCFHSDNLLPNTVPCYLDAGANYNNSCDSADSDHVNKETGNGKDSSPNNSLPTEGNADNSATVEKKENSKKKLFALRPKSCDPSTPPQSATRADGKDNSKQKPLKSKLRFRFYRYKGLKSKLKTNTKSHGMTSAGQVDKVKNTKKTKAALTTNVQRNSKEKKKKKSTKEKAQMKSTLSSSKLAAKIKKKEKNKPRNKDLDTSCNNPVKRRRDSSDSEDTGSETGSEEDSETSSEYESESETESESSEERKKITKEDKVDKYQSKEDKVDKYQSPYANFAGVGEKEPFPPNWNQQYQTPAPPPAPPKKKWYHIFPFFKKSSAPLSNAPFYDAKPEPNVLKRSASDSTLKPRNTFEQPAQCQQPVQTFQQAQPLQQVRPLVIAQYPIVQAVVSPRLYRSVPQQTVIMPSVAAVAPPKSPYTGPRRNVNWSRKKESQGMGLRPHPHNVSFKDEFASLENFKRSLLQKLSFNVANRNMDKNRFPYILAPDHTRVNIEIVAAGDADYYNASYIRLDSGVQYIAAQTPFSPITVSDFWRMVLQNRVETIVMLCACVEGGVIKSEQYWADSGVYAGGHVLVETLSQKWFANFVVRTFKLCAACTDDVRVTQFQFFSWPLNGVPDDAIPFLELRYRVRSFYGNKTSPILVTCGTGVARSAVYIAVDQLIEEYGRDGCVNVFRFVKKMRRSRPFMVRNLNQYRFIYECLFEEFQAGDTVLRLDMKPQYTALCQKNPQSDFTYLMDQFRILSQFTSDLTQKECSVGSLRVNNSKNVDQRILPPDKYRPYNQLTEGDPGTWPYMNAVILNGHRRTDEFIVTQTPLNNTAFDFWKMVQDYQVQTIVMFGKCRGLNQEQYFPKTGGRQFGNLYVEHINTTKTDSVTTRNLKICVMGISGVEKRALRHFQIKNWEDSDTLSAKRIDQVPNGITDLLDLIEKVLDWQVVANRRTKPVVVVCGNGATLSGLFVASQVICEKMREDKEVDLYHTVKHIKRRRPMIVADFDQYRFLHQVLWQYIINFIPEAQKLLKLNELENKSSDDESATDELASHSPINEAYKEMRRSFSGRYSPEKKERDWMDDDFSDMQQLQQMNDEQERGFVRLASSTRRFESHKSFSKNQSAVSSSQSMETNAGKCSCLPVRRKKSPRGKGCCRGNSKKSLEEEDEDFRPRSLRSIKQGLGTAPGIASARLRPSSTDDSFGEAGLSIPRRAVDRELSSRTSTFKAESGASKHRPENQKDEDLRISTHGGRNTSKMFKKKKVRKYVDTASGSNTVFSQGSGSLNYSMNPLERDRSWMHNERDIDDIIRELYSNRANQALGSRRESMRNTYPYAEIEEPFSEQQTGELRGNHIQNLETTMNSHYQTFNYPTDYQSGYRRKSIASHPKYGPPGRYPFVSREPRSSVNEPYFNELPDQRKRSRTFRHSRHSANVPQDFEDAFEDDEFQEEHMVCYRHSSPMTENAARSQTYRDNFSYDVSERRRPKRNEQMWPNEALDDDSEDKPKTWPREVVKTFPTRSTSKPYTNQSMTHENYKSRNLKRSSDQREPDSRSASYGNWKPQKEVYHRARQPAAGFETISEENTLSDSSFHEAFSSSLQPEEHQEKMPRPHSRMLGNQPPLTTSQLEPNDENGQYYVCYRKSPSRPMPEPPIYVTEQRSSLSNPRNNAQPSMTDYQRATINEERSRSSPDKQRKSSLSAQDRDGVRLQEAHSMLDEDNLNFRTRRKSDVQGSKDFAFAAGDDEADEARASRRTSSLPLKTADSEFLPERRTTPYDEMFQEKLQSQRPSLKNQGGEVPQETPLDDRDRKAEIMNRPRSGYVDATPEHQQLLEKNLTSKTTPIRAEDSKNRTSQELTAVSSSISDSTSTRESRERMMLEDLDADDNDLTATSQRRQKNEGRPDTDLPRQSQTLVKQ
ncbi:tyrosine-protein phosphatase 99A, partial [Biomphalaria glabrata]